ncbi:unnamed protein product [Amoebophrya sp. A25]|nr:unnamed protein product [Amoebophrya sp. A25]|eukprot:GSA25T00009275001.1
MSMTITIKVWHWLSYQIYCAERSQPPEPDIEPPPVSELLAQLYHERRNRCEDWQRQLDRLEYHAEHCHAVRTRAQREKDDACRELQERLTRREKKILELEKETETAQNLRRSAEKRASRLRIVVISLLLVSAVVSVRLGWSYWFAVP